MNCPCPPSVPIWDLSLVLEAMKGAPFEPLESEDLSISHWKQPFWLLQLQSSGWVTYTHFLLACHGLSLGLMIPRSSSNQDMFMSPKLLSLFSERNSTPCQPSVHLTASLTWISFAQLGLWEFTWNVRLLSDSQNSSLFLFFVVVFLVADLKV